MSTEYIDEFSNNGKKEAKAPKTKEEGSQATSPKKHQVKKEPVDAGTKQEKKLGSILDLFRSLKQNHSEDNAESEGEVIHRRKVREKTTVARLIWTYFQTALLCLVCFWFVTFVFGEVWTWRCRHDGLELGGPHCDNLKWFLSFSHMVSFGSFGIVISKLGSIIASFA